MTKSLDIGIKLPLDVATRAIALVGNRGSGKTTTSTVLVEQMYKANVPVVIIDPVGARWGIRSSADGKSAGLPFTLFGGKHDPDAPLYEESGETLADAVLEYGMNAVIDMSLLRKNAMRRFAADFLERLYEKSENSMHLVMEESPVFAPQRVDHGAERLLGACEDIVLRGRGRGIGVTLIAQRAQSINKSCLSQCEVLFALRQSHNLDKKAIKDWMDQQGDDHLEVIDKLAGLPTGECFVWAPVLDILERVKTRQRETFDSGATPKPGERRIEPKKRASIDMEALKGKLAATLEKAKATDPKLLTQRIRELERELAKKVPVAVPAPPERIEVPILERHEKLVLDHIKIAVDTLQGNLVHLTNEIAKKTFAAPSAPASRPAPKVTRQERSGDDLSYRPAIPPPAPSPTSDAPAGKKLRSGAMQMLRALASLGPLTRKQLATMVGIKSSGSTFSTYLSDLRGLAYVETVGDIVRITDAGARDVGDVEPPTDLADMWKGKLRSGASSMLQILLDAYPKAVARDDLARIVGIDAAGSTFSTYTSDLVSNGLAHRQGRNLIASEAFFMTGGKK